MEVAAVSFEDAVEAFRKAAPSLLNYLWAASVFMHLWE